MDEKGALRTMGEKIENAYADMRIAQNKAQEREPSLRLMAEKIENAYAEMKIARYKAQTAVYIAIEALATCEENIFECAEALKKMEVEG